jgi:hypothetical protein
VQREAQILHKTARRLLACLILGLGVSPAESAQAPPPAAGCDTAQSRQFDFWVGKWEVRPNGADKVIAHSLIEKRYSGCAVRENWMPLGKELMGGGGSLSLYDPRQKQWRQTWVDSSGARVDLDGGFVDGVMTITGNWPNFNGPGQDALVRMHYRKLPNGEVRQWAESSTDSGKSWKPNFDFLYRHIGELPDFQQ